MPFKDAAARRRYQNERNHRRVPGVGAPAPSPPPVTPRDPASALAEWAKKKLKVPPGHPLAGQPMVLPPFGVDFLRDALTHSESALLVARKNAKSAIVAVYLLGRLVGPLRVDGYRAGVVSVNRDKASELWQQCRDIALASGLEGLRFLKVPRCIEGPSGRVDILSADSSSGHASGFDDAIVDELGLLKERDRDLVNGMRSSISARGGRFLALSIVGDSPFTREIIARRDDPAVCVHLYQADPDAALDDEVQWRKANPGLGTIKSLQYMRDESRRVLASTMDQSSFRAHDLNVPVDPAREMIIGLSDWLAVVPIEVVDR